MATAALKGRQASLLMSVFAQSTSGSVTGNFVVTEIRNWNLVLTQEMIDASSADSSGWNEFIPGQRGWTLHAEAVYDGQAAGGGVALLLSKVMRDRGEIRRVRLAAGVAPTNGSDIPSSAQGIWYTSTGSGSAGMRLAEITNFRVGGRYNEVTLYDFELRGRTALLYSS